MKSNIKKLVYSSLLVAFSFGLSLIKIVHLPSGGSVTLFSMLAISMPAYYFGIKYGFIASISYMLLQLIDNLYIVHPLQVVFDYVIPFTIFGIVGFFKNKKEGLTIGFTISCIVRFISSSISGYIFFKEYAPLGENLVLYTITYNGGYIFTEMIMSIIFMHIPSIKKIIEEYKYRFNK